MSIGNGFECEGCVVTAPYDMCTPALDRKSGWCSPFERANALYLTNSHTHACTHTHTHTHTHTRTHTHNPLYRRPPPSVVGSIAGAKVSKSSRHYICLARCGVLNQTVPPLSPYGNCTADEFEACLGCDPGSALSIPEIEAGLTECRSCAPFPSFGGAASCRCEWDSVSGSGRKRGVFLVLF